MEELYCIKCGNKLASEDNFCTKCGAPRPAVDIRQTTQPVQTPPAYHPPAPVHKAAAKLSALSLVLIIVSSVVLLGAIGFGVWRIWLYKHTVDVAYVEKTAVSTQLPPVQTLTPGIAPSPASLPSESPTEVPLPSPSPEPSPIPTPSDNPPISSQLVYIDFIGTLDVPGMNEADVKSLIGEPKSQKEMDTEQGKITELDYGTFLLTFSETTGNVPSCASIRVYGADCPVSVCGLNTGMTKDDAESMLSNIQFNFIPTLDQSTLEYYNAELNQYIFIKYQDEKVIEFTAVRGD